MISVSIRPSPTHVHFLQEINPDVNDKIDDGGTCNDGDDDVDDAPFHSHTDVDDDDFDDMGIVKKRTMIMMKATR